MLNCREGPKKGVLNETPVVLAYRLHIALTGDPVLRCPVLGRLTWLAFCWWTFYRGGESFQQFLFWTGPLLIV